MKFNIHAVQDQLLFILLINTFHNSLLATLEFFLATILTLSLWRYDLHRKSDLPN